MPDSIQWVWKPPSQWPSHSIQKKRKRVQVGTSCTLAGFTFQRLSRWLVSSDLGLQLCALVLQKGNLANYLFACTCSETPSSEKRGVSTKRKRELQKKILAVGITVGA
jgi:hypothetical protein